ncbi:hypothetical protein Q4575_03965 [Psychrosphaera sp. 1_MG-2023]|uniref:hypothetical protein n=1 Tax=Psychrosphaera sp. 1_MG-2023 TaxID=3062643 RepID=UPI0026E24D50|nr:hypothetical protein [Psychrosphaera sp. 1_MG-2023]MDO6718540.1 hypothetical protein [Psychrosphaera sp. 1_MG-2023]
MKTKFFLALFVVSHFVLSLLAEQNELNVGAVNTETHTNKLDLNADSIITQQELDVYNSTPKNYEEIAEHLHTQRVESRKNLIVPKGILFLFCVIVAAIYLDNKFTARVYLVAAGISIFISVYLVIEMALAFLILQIVNDRLRRGAG